MFVYRPLDRTAWYNLWFYANTLVQRMVRIWNGRCIMSDDCLNLSSFFQYANDFDGRHCTP